jgi:hypothetical protein
MHKVETHVYGKQNQARDRHAVSAMIMRPEKCERSHERLEKGEEQNTQRYGPQPQHLPLSPRGRHAAQEDIIRKQAERKGIE